jgi:hypothetical protein
MPVFWDVTLWKKCTNVLEEYTASSFKVKEQTEKAGSITIPDYKVSHPKGSILYSYHYEKLNPHNRLECSPECNSLNYAVKIM